MRPNMNMGAHHARTDAGTQAAAHGENPNWSYSVATALEARHHRSKPTEIPEPPVARFLVADTRMAWFWLIVRLYAGWEWLQAGAERLRSPAWTGAAAGSAATASANGR